MFISFYPRMKSPTRLGGVSGKLGGGVGQIGGGAGQAWWHSRLYPEGFPGGIFSDIKFLPI